MNILLRERIDVEEASNVRLMISPLERVPVQAKIIDMLLSMMFVFVGTAILPIVGIEN